MNAQPLSASARRGRLDFLDALRGVAVGLVLVQHVGELAFPSFAAFTHAHLLLGQMGVMVFFLCSGFIIPASLERGRPEDGRGRRLAAFWRGRAFRLYPMYWLSLAAALALAGTALPAELSPADWLANATMLQVLAGAPNALTVYWTLGFEMLFYGALSLLFLAGLHRRSVLLSLSASVCCLLVAIGAALTGHAAPTGVFCLTTMVTGTVVHRWHTGDLALRWLVVCASAAASVAPLVLWSALLTTPQPPETPGFPAMLAAWLGAYAVFGVGVLLRARRAPRWLQRLGRISYSVYLVQAVVLLAVPPLASPALSAAIWCLTTLAASELTHRFVELPAIALGRRLGRRPVRGATPAAAVAAPAVPTPLRGRVLAAAVLAPPVRDRGPEVAQAS